MQSRRSFLRFGLMAAPAIVCAANIMSVRALIPPEQIDTQEIISILEGRLADPSRDRIRADNAPFGRGTWSLEQSIKRNHELRHFHAELGLPPPDQIWAK